MTATVFACFMCAASVAFFGLLLGVLLTLIMGAESLVVKLCFATFISAAFVMVGTVLYAGWNELK